MRVYAVSFTFTAVLAPLVRAGTEKTLAPTPSGGRPILTPFPTESSGNVSRWWRPRPRRDDGELTWSLNDASRWFAAGVGDGSGNGWE
jgi:hypothetical protein